MGTMLVPFLSLRHATFAKSRLHICKKKTPLTVHLDAVFGCLVTVEHAVVAHHMADAQAVV